MGVGNFTAAVGLQLETVNKNLEFLWPTDHTLYDQLADGNKKEGVKVVSGRPTRVPIAPIGPGAPQVANLDGGALGLGTGFTSDVMQLSPQYFSQALQWTKLAEATTDSTEKAVADYVEKLTSMAMDSMKFFLESLLVGSDSDGSNTLTTVTATGTDVLTVTNANQIADQQVLDIWPTGYGTMRGTVTVTSVDAPNKKVYLSGAVPTGTVATDRLLPTGSAGAQGTGIYSIPYYNNTGTGNVAGLSRATYPRLQCPYVSVAGPLTQHAARLLKAQLQIAIGIESAKKADLVYNCGLSEAAAWEDLANSVTTVIRNQVKGKNTPDMLAADVPATVSGVPLLPNIHSIPGRIDGVSKKHYLRVESTKLRVYDVGGQTVFPVYATSGSGAGGLNASMVSYMTIGVQIGNDNPRASVYADGISIPPGY